jgi:hypothetical protein
VLFFAFLPLILRLLGLAIAIAFLVTVVFVGTCLLWALTQAEPATLGALCIAVGVALVLAYGYAKAPQGIQIPDGMDDEDFRRKYPYLSAKLDQQRGRRSF